MEKKSRVYKKKTAAPTVGAYFTKWTRHLERHPESINTLPSETLQGEAIQLKDFVRMHAAGEIPEMAQSAFDFHGEPSDADHDLDVSPRYATDIVDRNESVQEIIQNQLDIENEILQQAAEEAANQQSNETKNEAQNDLNEKANKTPELD